MNAKEINFAYQVRHALNERLDAIPTSTAERLASARKIAISRKKSEKPLHVRVTHAVAAGPVGNFFSEPLFWLGRLGAAAPVLAGVLVFASMYQVEQQQRIADTAEIDAAVLSDDLPLTAYLDKGFNAYLAKRGE